MKVGHVPHSASAVPHADHDPVYGASVADNDQQLAAARTAIELEQEGYTQWSQRLEARDDAIRAYYESCGSDVSQNEVARTLGINPSTFRSIITRAPRARRGGHHG